MTGKGKSFSGKLEGLGAIKLDEFVAPKPLSTEMYLYHEPFVEVSSGKPFHIHAKIVGIDTGRVSLQINRMGGQFRNIPMVKKNQSEFSAEIPSDLVTPGMLNYRIILRKGKDVSVFPGNVKGDPFAWDTYTNETWKTYGADEKWGLEIYNPTQDRAVRTYPTFRRGFRTSYVTGEKPGQLILKMTSNDLAGAQVMGFQFAFSDKLRGRMGELTSFDKVLVRARSTNDTPVEAKIVLMCADASSVSAFITLTNIFQDIEIPLKDFIPDAAMLMPRPYPGFLPLVFKGPANNGEINLSEAERIEFSIGSGIPPSDLKKPYNLEVECIWFKKGDKGS